MFDCEAVQYERVISYREDPRGWRRTVTVQLQPRLAVRAAAARRRGVARSALGFLFGWMF